MTQPMPKQLSTVYESISDMRFDFKGDLIELSAEEKNQKIVHSKYLLIWDFIIIREPTYGRLYIG